MMRNKMELYDRYNVINFIAEKNNITKFEALKSKIYFLLISNSSLEECCQEFRISYCTPLCIWLAGIYQKNNPEVQEDVLQIINNRMNGYGNDELLGNDGLVQDIYATVDIIKDIREVEDN